MSSTYTGSIGAGGYGENKQGICPNNWTLPVYETWRAFVDAIETVSNWQTYNDGTYHWIYACGNTISLKLASPANQILAGNNFYGWSQDGLATYYSGGSECWRSNNIQNCDHCMILHSNVHTLTANCTILGLSTGGNMASPVRCFRTL
jgi:hypothetical protein